MAQGVPSTNPNIDLPRLFVDLAVTEDDLRRIAALPIPDDIRVPSVSAIKTDTVRDVLGIVDPGREFEVLGVKAPSGVAEQPLGQAAIDGALNRLRNGIELREQIDPGEADNVVWLSIENGLFRVSPRSDSLVSGYRRSRDVVQYSEDADLSTEFDPDAEYEDRAVTAIRVPGFPVMVQVSPGPEAVRFPKAAYWRRIKPRAVLICTPRAPCWQRWGL